jgi:hypothetical protein
LRDKGVKDVLRRVEGKGEEAGIEERGDKGEGKRGTAGGDGGRTIAGRVGGTGIDGLALVATAEVVILAVDDSATLDGGVERTPAEIGRVLVVLRRR